MLCASCMTVCFDTQLDNGRPCENPGKNYASGSRQIWTTRTEKFGNKPSELFVPTVAWLRFITYDSPGHACMFIQIIYGFSNGNQTDWSITIDKGSNGRWFENISPKLRARPCGCSIEKRVFVYKLNLAEVPPPSECLIR